jgi:hypothetical protein
VLIGAPSEAQGRAALQEPRAGARGGAAAPATDPDQAGRKAAAAADAPADALLARRAAPEEAAVLVDDQAARADQPRIVARSAEGPVARRAVVAPSRAQDRAAERKKRLAGAAHDADLCSLGCSEA